MKNIIITGANGLVATELTLQLLKQTDSFLFLLSTHVEILLERYSGYSNRIRCFTLQTFSEFLKKESERISFDICIHTAFSRSANGHLIVESLNYQQELIGLLKCSTLKTFINVSSQSVYGKMSVPLWKENTPLEPDYLYAMGKYSSEVITRLMLMTTGIKWTNIRLCSVMGNARFVRVFVQNAIEGKAIHLTAPDQHCSFIDVRDVAHALHSLIENVDTIALEKTYNLSANLVCSIGKIAQRVKEIGEEIYGISNVIITESESDNHNRIGMDASLFMQTFNWKPQYGINEMIKSVYEELIKANENVSSKPLK